MRELVARVPIPLAGVALGLAALGNLVAPWAPAIYGLCGILAALCAALLLAKVMMFPAQIREDFQNPILASVSATFCMALMQLAGYTAVFSFALGFVLWIAAVSAHLVLMGWFGFHFIRRFSLSQVFPTWFITYVGIIVAAVTAPLFSMEALGTVLFWFGFASYPVLLATITVRYIKHPVPEAARPLFCIYTAPASLSLVGYLAITPEPNLLFATALLVAAQAFLILVLFRLPQFLALSFYPSYAAMTFPFVITATALTQMLGLFALEGIAVPEVLNLLCAAETFLAVAMVSYVVVRYAWFLTEPLRASRNVAAQEETTSSLETA